MRERVAGVVRNDRVGRAFRYLAAREHEIEEEQIRISLIPSPPFGEARRAAYIQEALREAGLHPVIDAIGNVIAAYEGSGPHPVVVAAHMDTIFPVTVPLQLRRKGRVLYLPGISDNGSGLVALLWLVRAAKEAGLRFERPVVVVANVGEEGEGNLRGIRRLFQNPPWEGHSCEFIAIDSGGIQRLTHQALGSRRFRVRMTGPGGHSWADFGKPNPIYALAETIHRFTSNHLEKSENTSYNVGVIRGGLSVNAIPSEATMDVDIRSVDASHVADLERHLRVCAATAAREGTVDCTVEITGERPSGSTSIGTPLVEVALESTRHFGVEPELDVGSTDANVPMSLGIPAIALGAGGTCGNIHTLDEWFDPTNRHLGLWRLLMVVSILGGVR